MAFENYLSTGVHIGMKQQTKDMKKFIYKVRNDGLAVLNVALIDERIKIAAKFLSKFDRLMIVSRKISGHKAASKFAEITGTRANIGRFLPGTITNPAFKGYYEPQAVIITDPLVDKQAVTEAVKMRIPIIALCDTFNETRDVDFVIPCNNKGRKSIATVYFTLAQELMKTRGAIKSDEDFTFKPEDFEVGEDVSEKSDTEDRKPRRAPRDRNRGRR